MRAPANTIYEQTPIGILDTHCQALRQELGDYPSGGRIWDCGSDGPWNFHLWNGGRL